ncbi:MAG: class I SAM-dependent methyltransferase [Myxococcales bacterium]|nr:class I SAM-dependent methyltransferase [Myxococcales bacterium]
MCHTNITREDELTERLFQGAIHALELYSIYLGKELGLYEALHAESRQTPSQLAARAGIHPRYAREWLEQQATAGLIVVDDAGRPADERGYTLPHDHLGVLLEQDHAAHVAPFAHMLVGIAGALPKVVRAYRDGSGVPYELYGADFRAGQGGINRPAFVSDLAEQWLPAIPRLHARLLSEPTRVADVGCGEGWATIGLARAYPQAEVVGYDLDLASIEAARRHAEQAGVSVRFVHGDAVDFAEDGFDLVLLLEALHDMTQPTEALRALRGALSRDGAVLIADERVAERFSAPGDEIERMMYGWSVSHCLPAAMVDPNSEAIGTAIRPDRVRHMAREAGYGRCEVQPIDNQLFRFFLLQ